MKFRILTDGRTFKVQYKNTFGLFWHTFGNEEGVKHHFNTQEQAVSFIKQKKFDFGVQKWKVVATYSGNTSEEIL